jgi:lipopolysaccharide heptosyltransferase III
VEPQGPEASVLASLPAGSSLLLIRLRSIGDIVLLTPALRLLKEWRPDLKISVLVESRFRELLEGNPDVDEILALESARGAAGLARSVLFAASLRRRKFAVCINLHGGPTSAWFTATCGAPRRVGFAHFRKQWLYNLRVPDAKIILGQSKIHTAEHQACVFFWLGMPRKEIPPARLVIPEAAAGWWTEQRSALGIPQGHEYAVMHPTALYPTKQWAPEQFARLGAWLEKEHGLLTLYTAGPGESVVLDAVERAAGSSILRLESSSLARFAAVLGGARLFVGNDSGPAHMAAALSKPFVVIFGSSSSHIWGPWPRLTVGRSTQVVQNFYACNPCPGDRCYQFERPECILSVRFEQVRDAVENVILQSTHSSA